MCPSSKSCVPSSKSCVPINPVSPSLYCLCPVLLLQYSLSVHYVQIVCASLASPDLHTSSFKRFTRPLSSGTLDLHTSSFKHSIIGHHSSIVDRHPNHHGPSLIIVTAVTTVTTVPTSNMCLMCRPLPDVPCRPLPSIALCIPFVPVPSIA
jgi:hypothetical protein